MCPSITTLIKLVHKSPKSSFPFSLLYLLNIWYHTKRLINGNNLWQDFLISQGVRRQHRFYFETCNGMLVPAEADLTLQCQHTLRHNPHTHRHTHTDTQTHLRCLAVCWPQLLQTGEASTRTGRVCGALVVTTEVRTQTGRVYLQKVTLALFMSSVFVDLNI